MEELEESDVQELLSAFVGIKKNNKQLIDFAHRI